MTLRIDELIETAIVYHDIGTYSGTGAKMSMKPESIKARVVELEKRYGKLFTKHRSGNRERTSWHVTLTDVGKAILDISPEYIAARNEAAAEFFRAKLKLMNIDHEFRRRLEERVSEQNDL